MRSFLIDFVAPLIAFGAADETAGIGIALELIPLVAFAVWNSGYRQGRTGQSIGRRVTKTKLVKLKTGEPIGFGMALLRLICVAVIAVPWGIGLLSHLHSLQDPKRQTGADRIFKAVVVHIDDAPEERSGTGPRRR